MTAHRYLVSARKYRPSSFHEVVGQEHVTSTLKNAIRLDRLAHAYLFSGPRGVGKTTGARILAKAINCETPLADRVDESEPCQKCNSCVTFDEGRSMNVIEVDAASNNKVDDIRELRDTVRIPPQGAKRKVYIIDEVHMLSASAFNALLKTLEEPPPYVLFIFATTEPHKVLPTILSRCQRFDYRRITVPEIITQLQMISKSEKIKVDEASLMLIARKGDGALRDALSAFDQAVALCGSDISYEELAKAFRVVDVDIYFDVTDSAAKTDSAGMLRLVDQVVAEGYDLHEFLNGLLGHLRNIYVALSMNDTQLIEATADVRKRYAKTAKNFQEADLLRMMTVVADTEDSIRYSAQPRLTVELGALKLVQMSKVQDLQALIDRANAEPPGTASPAKAKASVKQAPSIERSEPGAAPSSTPDATIAKNQGHSEKQEKRTASVAPPKRVKKQEPDSGVNTVAESPTPTRSKKHAAQDSSDSTADAEKAFADASALGNEYEMDLPPIGKTNSRARERVGTEPPQTDNSLAAVAARGPSSPRRSLPGAEPPALAAGRTQPSPSVDNTPGLFGPPALQARSRSSAAATVTSDKGDAGKLNSTQVESEKSEELRSIESIWLAYVRNVKNERVHVGALLQHSSPAGIADGKLTVSVPDDFHRRLLTNQEAFLREQLLSHTDLRIVELYFEIRSDHAMEEEVDEVQNFDPQEYLNKKRKESPMIRALFDEFGGELVW